MNWTGRPLVFMMGAVANAAAISVLFAWKPAPGEEWVLYVVAALWGTGDAVWQTQINALYGVLFADCEEAAFSNYRLWESVGFIFTFILQVSRFKHFCLFDNNVFFFFPFLALPEQCLPEDKAVLRLRDTACGDGGLRHRGGPGEEEESEQSHD